MIHRRALLTSVAALAVFPLGVNASARGTREEAIAMAERALEMYQAEGADTLFAAVADPEDARFHDRDLYVWIIGFDMVMRAHGVKPALAGKDLTNLTDVDGVKINVVAAEVAKADGKGWFSYKWQNPGTGTVDNKSSYVINVDDELIIGVGVYD